MDTSHPDIGRTIATGNKKMDDATIQSLQHGAGGLQQHVRRLGMTHA